MNFGGYFRMTGLGKNFQILVVDDERVIADTLAIIFTRAGYLARAAYSAEEALEMVPEWAPDVAVIDVILPKMNGLDFAVALRGICPECRTMFLSGQAATANLLEDAGAEERGFDVLAKPVHPSILLQHIEALLAEAADEHARVLLKMN